MSYRIGNIPSDPAALPQFLQQELARIQELWNSPLETLPLAVLYKAPVKPRPGIYLADGTRWDPGEGAGFYGWRDGEYHRLDCPCPSSTPRVLMLGLSPDDVDLASLYVFDSSTGARTLFYSTGAGVALGQVFVMSPDGTARSAIDSTPQLLMWKDGVLTAVDISSTPAFFPTGITNDGLSAYGNAGLSAYYWNGAGVVNLVADPESQCNGVSGDAGTIDADYLDGVPTFLPKILVGGVRIQIGTDEGQVRGVSNNGRYVCGEFSGADNAFIYDKVADVLTRATTPSEMFSVSDAGVAIGVDESTGSVPAKMVAGDNTVIPLASPFAGGVLRNSPDGRVISGYAAVDSTTISLWIDESFLVDTGLTCTYGWTTNVLA